MLSGSDIFEVSMGAGTKDSKSDKAGGPETRMQSGSPMQRNGIRVTPLSGSAAS